MTIGRANTDGQGRRTEFGKLKRCFLSVASKEADFAGRLRLDSAVLGSGKQFALALDKREP